MPRYVILYHDCPPEIGRASHWDLMLEREGVLQTWALAEPPEAGKPVAAEALDDHRLAYLEYQGPLSADRGEVARWDAGNYEIESEDHSDLLLRLAGDRLVGRLRLASSAGARPADERFWTAEFTAVA